MNDFDNSLKPYTPEATIPTFSRRTVLVASAAGALLAGSAVAHEATPATVPVTDGGSGVPSSLLVGVAGGPFGDFTYQKILTFDASFASTGSVETVDGVMDVFPTGDPNVVLMSTMGATGLLDIDDNALVEIDWGDVRWDSAMSQWPLGILSSNDGDVRNAEWVVSTSFEGTAIVAINLRTREGSDITEFVNQNDQEYVPALAKYMASGSILGLWTGDNVYLIDLEQPETARRLVGDDPDLFSTTYDIDPTGTWCSYTTYDPRTEDAAGRVYIENVESGEYVEVIEGTAWSQVKFVPGDPEGFLLIAHGEVQLRVTADPQADGEPLASIDEQTHYQSVWDASGTKLMLGTRPDNDAPANWVLIDASAREAIELPELEGLSPLMITAAQPAPTHLLFGLATEEPGPVFGFDFDSGEVVEYLAEVNLGSLSDHSSSADGGWYFLVTENRGDTRGAWLVNNREQTMHELPWGDGLYTLAGAVSPDGAVAAITTIARPSDEVTTHSVFLESPTELNEFTEGHVLGWS